MAQSEHSYSIKKKKRENIKEWWGHKTKVQISAGIWDFSIWALNSITWTPQTWSLVCLSELFAYGRCDIPYAHFTRFPKLSSTNIPYLLHRQYPDSSTAIWDFPSQLHWILNYHTYASKHNCKMEASYVW